MNKVCVLDGAAADCAQWGNRHTDISRKLDKAIGVLAVPGAELHGKPDNRFANGFRKLRLPRGNEGGSYGYRIPFFAFKGKKATYVIIGGIYPKPEYAKGVPEAYVSRIATEFKTKLIDVCKEDELPDSPSP